MKAAKKVKTYKQAQRFVPFLIIFSQHVNRYPTVYISVEVEKICPALALPLLKWSPAEVCGYLNLSAGRYMYCCAFWIKNGGVVWLLSRIFIERQKDTIYFSFFFVHPVFIYTHLLQIHGRR